MNKTRREQVNEIIGTLEDVKCSIENLHDEEEEAYYNLPDSLQESDRGFEMSDNIDSFDNAQSSIQDCIDYLQEIIER